MDDTTGLPTETTIQFVLYQALPVVTLSLSPEVQVERVDFRQNERHDSYGGVGELYIYRPVTPLAPETAYEVTLELARGENEDTVTHTWLFTTDGTDSEGQFADVVLPLYPASVGGSGALTGGDLYVEGRCLYLRQSGRFGSEGDLVFPIFEDGTVWWEGDILFHRGNRYRIGDQLRLGGGEVKSVLDIGLARLPHESCDMRRAWRNSR